MWGLHYICQFPHFCHILLAESKSQIPPTLKGSFLYRNERQGVAIFGGITFMSTHHRFKLNPHCREQEGDPSRL